MKRLDATGHDWTQGTRPVFRARFLAPFLDDWTTGHGAPKGTDVVQSSPLVGAMPFCDSSARHWTGLDTPQVVQFDPPHPAGGTRAFWISGPAGSTGPLHGGSGHERHGQSGNRPADAEVRAANGKNSRASGNRTEG